MVNKRGEMSMSLIASIIILLILLVLVIVASVGGFTPLFDRLNIFGGSTTLSSIEQACSQAILSNSVTTYCNSFNKVKLDGKTVYINCAYEEIQNTLGEKKLSCDNPKVETNQCQTLISDKYRSRVFVNDQIDQAKVTEMTTDCEKNPIFVNSKTKPCVCSEYMDKITKA